MRITDLFVGLSLFALLATGCDGCGVAEKSPCECEKDATISEDAIATSSETTGSISNYEYDGDFIADAACHADMFIYFEWLDSNLARTTQVPPIEVSFETPTGYFPNPDMKTRETLISTSEAGDIIHHQYYYGTSQAQNKNSPGGTSYSIVWTYDASQVPGASVKIGSTITNKVYDANEYSRTDLKSCAN